MGIYEKLILPLLLDLALRNSRLARYREQTIGAARDLVLEIGVGSGLNLPIFGPAVDRVCGIDLRLNCLIAPPSGLRMRVSRYRWSERRLSNFLSPMRCSTRS